MATKALLGLAGLCGLATDAAATGVQSDVLAYGFTLGGRPFSLASDGQVAFLKDKSDSTDVLASGACTLGSFASSVGAEADESTLFALSRVGGEDAKVHIVGIDVSNGDTVVSNELPFYGGDAQQDFVAGYDFYMDVCATCDLDAGLNSGSNTTSRLVVTGPDEIQFIHMVTVEPTPKKAHYNDFLQYSGGYRLARSVSAFDTQRGEEWLQVVYDVSLDAGVDVKTAPVEPYWKRYDVAKKTVVDIIPDISTAVAVEFDPKSASLIILGNCGNQTSQAEGGQCVYRIDPSKATSSTRPRGRHAGESATSSAEPHMELIAPLSANIEAVMGGSSTLDAEAGYLIVVAALSNTTSEGATDTALSCEEESQVGPTLWCHNML